MSKMYVVLGNHRLKETVDEGLKQSGLVKLLVEEEVLENTYQGFLEECCEYIAKSSISEQCQATINAVRQVADFEDVTSRIFLYDRHAQQGGLFSLNDIVQDTAGEYVYRTEQTVDGERVDLETLEMYVLSTPMGG